MIKIKWAIIGVLTITLMAASWIAYDAHTSLTYLRGDKPKQQILDQARRDAEKIKSAMQKEMKQAAARHYEKAYQEAVEDAREQVYLEQLNAKNVPINISIEYLLKVFPNMNPLEKAEKHGVSYYYSKISATVNGFELAGPEDNL